MIKTVNTKRPLKVGGLYYRIEKVVLGYTLPEPTIYRVDVDYGPGFWFETKHEANEFWLMIPKSIKPDERICILEIATEGLLNCIVMNKTITDNIKPTTLKVGINIVVIPSMSFKPLKFNYSNLFNLIQM